MKTKTIFKTLAMAMMMPAMMLTTACSSDDDAIANNPENNNQKGYAIPVTVNVTRQGDATTRAEYNESTKELAFSTGDQLFVQGSGHPGAGQFAGTLEWQSGGTFSGTIYTQYEYTGTADALLTGAGSHTATLLPDGYDTSYEYLSISGSGYSATLATDATKAFATTKAEAVEQLSLEQATTYTSGTGFALAPQNAILNFTVTGLTVGTPSTVSFTAGSTTISGSVTPVEVDYRATATFAMAVAHSATASSLTLTVDGTAVSLGSHTLTAGKIYNQKLHNLNGATPNIATGEKWLIYGTGETTSKSCFFPEGSTVTLYNVNLQGRITCRGNATIILADGTTNTLTGASNGPALLVDPGKTLTIKGTGTLNATGANNSPAIGADYYNSNSCGDITIESTVHLTATAGEGQTKAIATNGGGTVTIGGVVYADGADSPFAYPAPASPYASLTAEDVGKIIGADGKIYATKAAAEAVATGNAVAMIAYVGTASDCAHGLAIALADESGKKGYGAAGTACNGKAAVTGGTWRLPSIKDWQYMFIGCGASGSYSDEPYSMSYSGLASKLTTAQGEALQADYYWSSTEFIPGNVAWSVNFDGSNAYFMYADESNEYQVRACLAF